MHPRELEEIVGRSLRRLPAPRAPETLLPRVIAAVQAWAQRPWYARAWFTWPPLLQIGSIAAFVLLAGVAAIVWPEVRVALVSAVAAPLAPALARVSETLRGAGSALLTIRVLWRAMVAPFVPYLFVWVAAMCAACAAFAAAINRVAMANHAQR